MCRLDMGVMLSVREWLVIPVKSMQNSPSNFSNIHPNLLQRTERKLTSDVDISIKQGPAVE